MSLDHFHSLKTHSPQALRELLLAEGEIALIDLREEGEFGLGHILVSTNLPYSRLEAEIGTRVPRRDVPLVLVGDAAVIAAASEALLRLGYGDLSYLTGGTKAWADAGFELFDGSNVPSKAFAEVLEVAQHTPHISAADLTRLRREGVELVLLDSRTPEEFSRFHVPGALSAPGVELTARAEAFVPSPDTLVVVSCAGRTRSIIGAQGLINFGLRNRVVSLAGGTQGWRIAGYELETSPAEPVPALEGAAKAVAAERAEALRGRYGIKLVTLAEVADWLRQEARTTYLIDVRSRSEYEAGHVPQALWVPGGQLVQTTDQWIGTRGARVVLTDEDGVRASVAAHWLWQLGYEVAVLIASGSARSEDALAGWTRHEDLPQLRDLHLDEARDWQRQGALLVFADPSGDYRLGHPAGSVWRNRSDVARSGALPAEDGRKVIVFGKNRVLTTLLAAELARSGRHEVATLAAGLEAAEAFGLPLETSDAPQDEARIDTLFWLHRRHFGDLSQSQAYLDWELELPERVRRDGLSKFRIG